MSQTFRVVALHEALSPISHNSGTEGNESLINREQVATDSGIVHVPTLSGNALRHRAIREPGARWLVEHYELVGALSKEQLNWLFHGGTLTEGGGRESTSVIADCHRLFPLIRILGGSLPWQILAGNMHVGRGLLVCEENRRALSSVLPAEWPLPAERLRSAEHFVGGYQYTRGDAAKTVPELIRRTEENGESSLMIFAGQSLCRGSLFVSDFVLPHSETVELGCLLHALWCWQIDNGGTIGGQAARGHGKLRTYLHITPTVEPTELIAEYLTHVVSVQTEATAFLDKLFAAKEAKPKKGARKLEPVA